DEEHARRRLEPARTVDDLLRQRTLRRQRPYARSAADRPRGPRRGFRFPGTPHHLSARNARYESFRDHVAAGRCGSGSHRGFDGTPARHLAFMIESFGGLTPAPSPVQGQEPKGPAPIGVVYNTSMARADAALALATLYVESSRREAKVNGICITGSGFDAAV